MLKTLWSERRTALRVYREKVAQLAREFWRWATTIDGIEFVRDGPPRYWRLRDLLGSPDPAYLRDGMRACYECWRDSHNTPGLQFSAAVGVCVECTGKAGRTAEVFFARDSWAALQGNYRDIQRHRRAIQTEMHERGARGEIWSNGRCQAWPAYQEAISRFNALCHQQLGDGRGE